ncbi:unnamed protein product [Trichobilharzia regenti]|nr:unnamed protein product [Trichobilharzia regenti]
MLHALGVMHEIMRPDRDQYVILHEENIDKAYLPEFMKIKDHQSILADRPFDFQSISLYDPFTFTSNGNPVWEPIINLDDIPLFSISEKYLSFEDTVGLNRLYQCDKYAYERCHDDVNQTAYCSKAVVENKCYDEPRFAIPFCRRTCGRCFRAGSMGISTPPKKLCRDVESELCENYVKEGYCHFDGWTKLNCQRSCNLCPSPDVVNRQVETGDVRAYLEAYRKGDCFNRYDDLRCEIFSQRGDCRTNPGFMSSQCTQSCGLCPKKENHSQSGSKKNISETTRQPIPCKNYIDDQRCDALAKEGKCHGTTLKQCLGSCNKCGENYPRQTTENPPNLVTDNTNHTENSLPTECKDKSNLCSFYKDRNECKTHKVIRLEICPETCGSCETKCEDFDLPNICEDLVQRGYCKRSKAYAERCRKSCGLCGDEIIPMGASSPSSMLETEMTPFATEVTSPSVQSTVDTTIPTTTMVVTTKTAIPITESSTTPGEVVSTKFNMVSSSLKKPTLLRKNPSSLPKYVNKRTFTPSECKTYFIWSDFHVNF